MKINSNFFDKSKEFQNISQKDNIYLNFLYILVILFPLLLLTGPFLPDLVVVICGLSFIYINLKYKLFSLFENNIFKIFLLFWIYIIFTSLISDNILFSLKSSFFYIRFIIFSLFVLFLIKNYISFLKFFFYTLTITLLIVLIDSNFQFFFDKSLTGFEKPKLRLTGPFGDRQIVGSFISRILPLYLFLFFYIYKKINYKFLSFLFLLSVLVLFSGERTAFFMLTLFLFAVYFLFTEKIKNFLVLILFYTLTSVLLISITPSLKERIVVQTIQGFAFKNYKKNEDGFVQYFNERPKRGFYIFSRAHEVHYLTAIKMFQDRPLLGLGPNMFRKKCSDKKFFIEQSSCTTHPHNFLLQILAETGLIGAVFYILVMILILREIISKLYYKRIKKINLSLNQMNRYILCFGFFINTFLIILPNGNFFNNYLNAVMFIPLGFFMFMNENDK